MYYQLFATTDNFVPVSLGDVCNLTVNNLDLANSIDISSNGQAVDIGRVFPNNILTLDQNRFPYNRIYVRSTVAGSPANIQVWGW